MTSADSSFEILLKATARARSLRASPVVVKLGGSAMEDPAATHGTLQALTALQTLGVPLVLVHGGGKPIDRAMEAAGLTPIKVQGRRYTDDATMDIVARVLKQLNAELETRLVQLGAHAFALDARDEPILSGERLLLPGLDLQPIDLGRVGYVTEVIVQTLEDLLDESPPCIPIVASLAKLHDASWLNINADSAASAVAGAMAAESCLFLTDTPGILRDRTDPTTRIDRLNVAECRELIGSGVIDGGMIPKVEACLEALQAGAQHAVILDGRNPNSLLLWFLGEPAGTVVVS